MRAKLARRPSPAMVIAVIALVAAVGGEAIADVATKALTKKEKKQIKKIATARANAAIDQRAPGLSVAFANRASLATRALDSGGVDGQSVLRLSGDGSFAAVRPLGQIGRFVLELGCAGGGAQLRVRTTTGTGIYSDRSNSGLGLSTSFTVVVDSLGSGNQTMRAFVLSGGPSIVTGAYRLSSDAGINCNIRGLAIGS